MLHFLFYAKYKLLKTDIFSRIKRSYEIGPPLSYKRQNDPLIK